MALNENNTAAARHLDAEDYLDAIRRRRAWLFGPLLAGLVLAVSSAYLWPETYQSTAVLRVQSPILDPIFLASPLGTTLSDRIAQMATSITSRSALEAVITTYGLYPGELKRMPVEDVVEMMRRNIQISPVQALNMGNQKGTAAFSIRFSYRDRLLAQKVAAELVGRFMSENQRTRGLGQGMALGFGKSQLDSARTRLEAAETKLAAFRSQYQGKLPDQVESSLQQMNAMQMRFSMVQNSTARASQELLMLKTNLAIDEEKAVGLKKDTVVRPKSEKLLAMEREMAALENLIAALKDQYTDKHPDLRAARQRLERVTLDRDRLAKQEEASASSRPAGEVEANIRRYRAQVEAKTIEIEDLNVESRRISESIHVLDARIQQSPGVEREYGDRTRERDSAKAEFVDAETRYRKLADSGQGEIARLFETLEQLDSASLPTEPVEPKRPWIIGFGGAMGLLLGLTLVGAQEWQDPSLKNLKDVRTYTNLTVLSSIPEIENDLVVRRRKRIEFLGWTVSVALGVLMMAGAVGYYYATRT